MSGFLLACAVCGAGEADPSRGSYIWMSIIISLLPLGMIGGVIAYIALKTRAAEAEKSSPEQTLP